MSDLARFIALDPHGESEALCRARDAAFSRYGEVAHLAAGGSRCTVSTSRHLGDLGLVGDLVLEDDGVLDDAFAWLRERGCNRVQGPISRHTWYPFRAVTDGFDACPPFAGEPHTPPSLPARLTAAGMAPVAWYVSTWTADLRAQEARTAAKLRAFEERGYTVRALDPARLEDDLRIVHDVTLRAFTPEMNWLFHPIDFDEFRLVLAGGAKALDPSFVQVAFGPNGDAAAYIYATAEPSGMCVIKTLAVAPEHAGAGVGGALAIVMHALLRARGLAPLVHGLMRADGPTTSISSASAAQIFRRYAVFERSL